jgi:hypothetical protein
MMQIYEKRCGGKDGSGIITKLLKSLEWLFVFFGRILVTIKNRIYDNSLFDYFENNLIRKMPDLYVSDNFFIINKTIVMGIFGDILITGS